MYRDNRNGELYEDYESAYDAMLETMDYEQARDWNVEALLRIIIHNCPDAIRDEICECEENFFKENFEEVDEEEE